MPSVLCEDRETLLHALDHPRRPLVSLRHSLLHREILRDVTSVLGPGDRRVIARDPLAGGQLDGTAWMVSPYDTRPGAAPPSIGTLAGDFERVKPFGFLALRGQRTLAQAALRFVVETPGVLTTSLPLPAPERLAELLHFERSAPFTEAERRRVDVLGISASRPHVPGPSAVK